MPAYEVRLKKKEEVAEGTMAFHFEKPADFPFKPGQFAELRLPNPPENDAEGNSRAFSIASSPGESDLLFATRLRDTAFKRVLKNASPATKFELEGPFGNLVLHNKASRAGVFIAGGIGITPFRSMILDAAERRLPHKLVLFYSNRRPEDAAFLDDLERAARLNPNFKLAATMTQMQKSSRPWNGPRGYLDAALLARHTEGLNEPIYYLAGPPEMLAAMGKVLTTMGVDQDDVRAEEFAGY